MLYEKVNPLFEEQYRKKLNWKKKMPISYIFLYLGGLGSKQKVNE